jgi:cell division protein FtsZ
MQGARGLLISITGGPDLTLYEVDEAASRIREEVDPDCNIILGATYDPDLNGTIRVSVVATGTDATMVQALEPVQANQSRAPLTATRRPAPSPDSAAYEPVLETQVQQAVADAITSEPANAEPYQDDGVIVEPYIPTAMHAPLEDAQLPREEPIPSVYVPSAAERPDAARRLPRTEELPAVARRSLPAQEKHEPEPRNARALFKRLASNVGLGLRPAEPSRNEEPHYSSADDAAARSAIEAGASRVSHAAQPTEGALGGHDGHGRHNPQKPGGEHIEIPAFLRKHG